MLHFLRPDLPLPPRRALASLVLLALALTFPRSPARANPAVDAQAVPPAACFAMEALPAEDRQLGETWLLEALDKEALYTVASPLKPASLSFLAGRISVTQPTPEEQDALRRAARIVATWHCGPDLAATLVPGTVVIEGRRVVHVVFYRKAGIRAAIAAFPQVYGAAGIVPELPAGQVLATIELLPPPLRHRAWGHLLGYPAYAVDFFASADEAQRASGDSSVKGIVPRDFVSVPVFARATNHFVWAAPKGHQENDADRDIRQRAAPVLERYRQLRETYIGPQREGVLKLVRALLCTDDGCGPLPATTSAPAP